MVQSAVKAAVQPKKFQSRTASKRFQERKVTQKTDPSFFGLELPDEIKYDWPVLPANLPEDLSKRKIADARKANKGFVTVQAAASEHFPKFVEKLGDRATAFYVDTHASPLSNDAKPDQVHPGIGSIATPALVRFLGDLKKRRSAPSFTAEEKEHVVGFALQWLEMEPARKHFFVYLSDLEYFQLFKVDQMDGAVLESPVLDFRSSGQQWLAALLMADDETVAFPALRLPAFGGVSAELQKFLGQGSMSLVYSDRDHRAIKLFKGDKEEAKRAATAEYNNLVRLNDEVSSAELPDLVRKMIPLKDDVVLSDCGTALQLPRVGDKPVFSGSNFAHLVDFLATLHQFKFAHRDMRPDNLVSYESLLLPIDFGSLCALGEALPYHGTTHYASEHVSKQLGEKSVVVNPSDDLVSLVCCARQLVNIDDDFAEELFNADPAQFWSRALTGGNYVFCFFLAQECFFSFPP
jgi:hypothetical protein